MPKAILVTGATGKQGGSLIDALLRRNSDIEILAVTRDTSSSGAQRLEAKSPKVVPVRGDLDQPDAILTNAKKATVLPIWGVFSVQVRGSGDSDQDVEVRQGKELIDVALKNNIQFFVYTSVDRGGDASFDNPTPVPHFTSKYHIEHYLVEKCRGTEMEWTILRPVCFMENINPTFLGKVFATSWKAVVKDRLLQLVSVADIGFFAAQAFANPDQWRSKAISLAGSQLTFNEMAGIFGEKTGRYPPMTFDCVSWFYLWMNKDSASLFRWLHDSGIRADIPAVKLIHPGLKDFATWLETDSGYMA